MSGPQRQPQDPIVRGLDRTRRDLGVDLSPQHLGVAHDVVEVGDRGVSWGFGIARFATNAGFGIASACIKKPAELLESVAGPNVISSGLQGADRIVGAAHKATTIGQDIAQGITHMSLHAVKSSLEAAGAQKGELLRLSMGDEAAEAVIAVEAMVRHFATPLSSVPLPHLLAAASAWAALQRAAGQVRIRDVEHRSAAVALPDHSERWLRFTAASFGAAWFAGLLEGFSLSAAARASAVAAEGGDPGKVALAVAGIEGLVEVLEFQEKSTELFAPGYLVAVDHETGHVIVALRGTSSVHDALSDLICEPAEVTLGGHEGVAHDGMLRAARRLDGQLAELVERGLARLAELGGALAPRRVLLCGHSLGAGVSALLAAVWRDQGRFPGADLRCIAFACPQILDEELAMAQSNFTTTVIVGVDVVPRLSLATSQDLRAAMLHLSNPEIYRDWPQGHAPFRSPADIMAAAVRDDEVERLAATRDTVRRATRSQAIPDARRLFPAGRLIHLAQGDVPRAISHEEIDELVISGDMISAHMPRRYLLGVQEAASAWALREAAAAVSASMPPPQEAPPQAAGEPSASCREDGEAIGPPPRKMSRRSSDMDTASASSAGSADMDAAPAEAATSSTCGAGMDTTSAEAEAPAGAPPSSL